MRKIEQLGKIADKF